MTRATTYFWTASDGVELAFHEMGQGKAVVLLHGLFSDAKMNWIKFGHAARIADSGFRVIMPDLRAHGESAKPHDAGHYPPGILARDLGELIEHLGLAEFNLGGFSLGARTVVEAVGEGLRPRKAVLAGMGLEGLKGWAGRKRFFLDAIALYDTASREDPHWLSIQFMKTMKIDRTAAALLLNSFRDADDDWLAAFKMPTLVICGREDHDNGSAQRLVNVLSNATFEQVPGTHMSSVTKPDLGEAIARFVSS